MCVNYSEILACPAGDRALKQEGIAKREYNINSFANLDRKGLGRNHFERRLLLYTTRGNEQIYIQYPGKETLGTDPEKIRPWDFRPKAIREDGLLNYGVST